MSTKELITEKNFLSVKRRIEELLVRSWRMSRPLYPKMLLHFRVFPEEVYFSTVGQIWFSTPFWRGDAFALSILFHEGHHWNIYPVDIFRALRELYDARRLLAEELKFQPTIIKKSFWRTEEDWSKFPYSIEEFQFVENILGDYLVNLHIHDSYPTVWNDLWNFLFTEGTFYTKEKALKRDTTFMLYLAVYHELLPELPEVSLVEASSRAKVPQIARVVKDCRGGRISTTYALKELVKLFHENMQKDLQEGREGKEGEEKELRCPKCHSDEGWTIVAYQKEDGTWVDV